MTSKIQPTLSQFFFLDVSLELSSYSRSKALVTALSCQNSTMFPYCQFLICLGFFHTHIYPNFAARHTS